MPGSPDPALGSSLLTNALSLAVATVATSLEYSVRAVLSENGLRTRWTSSDGPG
jgi:hypothetical protein